MSLQSMGHFGGVLFLVAVIVAVFILVFSHFTESDETKAVDPEKKPKRLTIGEFEKLEMDFYQSSKSLDRLSEKFKAQSLEIDKLKKFTGLKGKENVAKAADEFLRNTY